MTEKEVEMQRKVESGLGVEANADSDAYRRLFNVIGKQPKIQLSRNFVDGVVQRIEAKRKRESRRDLIWLGFGVLFLIIGLALTAILAGLQFHLGFLLEMSAYAGVFIFGSVMIVLFNWLEKRTLEKLV